jgi:hypothetical protein
MSGKLNDIQIEDLLQNQVIGRIGCNADGITYIVPVTYVYDGINIYAHSSMGLKIDIMRKNPEVCFEVDEIRNMVNWQSVIVWGRFEELTSAGDKEMALEKLTERVRFLLTSETEQPAHGVTAYNKAATRPEAIWYRIVLNRKSGRFENN